MSSGVATPSSTRRTASFIAAACSRGTMKPGEAAQRTTTLPASSSSFFTVVKVDSAVAFAGLTSTSGIR
jgi:hypothetical protein